MESSSVVEVCRLPKSRLGRLSMTSAWRSANAGYGHRGDSPDDSVFKVAVGHEGIQIALDFSDGQDRNSRGSSPGSIRRARSGLSVRRSHWCVGSGPWYCGARCPRSQEQLTDAIAACRRTPGRDGLRRFADDVIEGQHALVEQVAGRHRHLRCSSTWRRPESSSKPGATHTNLPKVKTDLVKRDLKSETYSHLQLKLYRRTKSIPPLCRPLENQKNTRGSHALQTRFPSGRSPCLCFI